MCVDETASFVAVFQHYILLYDVPLHHDLMSCKKSSSSKSYEFAVKFTRLISKQFLGVKSSFFIICCVIYCRFYFKSFMLFEHF